MRITIEDTWFPASTKIRVGLGVDELSFQRCTFEGGEIFVEPEVNCRIFQRCVFQHTRFSGQPLSERISDACHTAAVGTEAATADEATHRVRFPR